MGRIRLTDELFKQCDSAAHSALLQDRHHFVRSAIPRALKRSCEHILVRHRHDDTGLRIPGANICVWATF
jgi:hypothetical protein